MRNQTLPLANDEIEWLRTIDSSKSPDLSAREKILNLARLLNGRFVMNYRNGDNWYDAHPLLWNFIVPVES